jgi:hypothetical protein
MPRFFFFIFLLLSFPLFVYGQGEEDSVEADLAELEKINTSKQSRAEELFKGLTPAEKEELQAAMEAGDTKAVMEKLQKKAKPGKEVEAMQALVGTALQNLRTMPEADVRDIVFMRSPAPVKSILSRFPRLHDCIVRVLRDEKALPMAFSIIQDRRRLLGFVMCNILVIFVAWTLRRAGRYQKNVPFVGRARAAFFRFVIFTSARIGILIAFFGTELKPLFEVLKTI